jgi:hypothetical protein
MSDQPPRKRRVGRPNKAPDADVTFEVTIPRHHYDYLEFLALKKRRLGISAKQAAELILVRELDALFTSGYHAREIPEE